MEHIVYKDYEAHLKDKSGADSKGKSRADLTRMEQIVNTV